MRTLVQQLIAEERRAALDADAKSSAAFRVCEKLRAPLSTLAGAAGFRSLLSRALVLARAKIPSLNGVQIKADGTFQYSAEFKTEQASTGISTAGTALADELLGLLITFVGEALTLRLVHEVWPKVSLKDPKSEGK